MKGRLHSRGKTNANTANTPRQRGEVICQRSPSKSELWVEPMQLEPHAASPLCGANNLSCSCYYIVTVKAGVLRLLVFRKRAHSFHALSFQFSGLFFLVLLHSVLHPFHSFLELHCTVSLLSHFCFFAQLILEMAYIQETILPSCLKARVKSSKFQVMCH